MEQTFTAPQNFLEEVWENQQMIPIRGFGKPQFSDWSLFSDRYGTKKYSNDEFPDLMIPEGWNWATDSQWQVDLAWMETDADGWVYASSLNIFRLVDACPSAQRQPRSFARRRRWVRLRECCTQEARDSVQLDGEKTVAWRKAHQLLLHQKEEWFAELQQFEQERKDKKKEVMKQIRADVLKAQNKLVKGSFLFEEIVNFLHARAQAEATYSRALVGLSEMKKKHKKLEVDDEEEVEELSPVSETVSPKTPTKGDPNQPPTPPNTVTRPSEEGKPASPSHMRSQSSPVNAAAHSPIFRPEKSMVDTEELCKKDTKIADQPDTETTLADAARKLSLSVDSNQDQEPGDLMGEMPPEFIGSDPEVYEAYDRVAALMTNFTTLLQLDLVKLVKTLAEEYMKVMEGFFRREIAELQASSQQSERELSMTMSTMKRAYSEMCRASAFDIQQFTLKLMNSDGEETLVTTNANEKGMVRPDVWLPEQKYRFSLHRVNKVLERIVDRVGEVMIQVNTLESRKENVLHYVNNSIVKHQSQLWAKVCTIGYDMSKDSGSIGEGIDADENESEEDGNDSPTKISAGLDSVPEEGEDPVKKEAPSAMLNLPKAPETRLVSIQGPMQLVVSGTVNEPNLAQCLGVLTMDRYLHLYAEEVTTLPWFGTHPSASFNLRETQIISHEEIPHALVFTRFAKSTVFGRKPQKKQVVLVAKNEEDFLNWTSAICNPLKDFGAPELAAIGEELAQGEGLSYDSSEKGNVVVIEEEAPVSPKDRPQRKGAYMTYLDGLNRILGVQVDVIDPSEAEEMALKKKQESSATAEEQGDGTETRDPAESEKSEHKETSPHDVQPESPTKTQEQVEIKDPDLAESGKDENDKEPEPSDITEPDSKLEQDHSNNKSKGAGRPAKNVDLAMSMLEPDSANAHNTPNLQDTEGSSQNVDLKMTMLIPESSVGNSPTMTVDGGEKPNQEETTSEEQS